MTKPSAVPAVATGVLAAALVGLAPQAAQAAQVPAPPPAPERASVAAAHDAAAAPATLSTLARFFARDGAVAAAKAQPRIEGAAVPVYVLSPDFVRGRSGATVSRLEYLASKAVSADGQKASVWTVRKGGAWKVVNIATGDDESRYARQAATSGGGTVFHEPQIDAWYVQRGGRIQPLDADAERAIGTAGTTVGAYQKRVERAYGDKLPGSAYDKRGAAGGYGPGAAAPDEGHPPLQQPVAAAAPAQENTPVSAASAVAGAAAVVALGLSGTVAVRRLRRR